MAQNSQKTPSSKRKRWRFEFGPVGMIGLGSVGVLIMAWAFILGILVGRGYKPESVISELSHMVPPLIKGDPSAAPSRPLLPEELRFFESLQEKVAPALPLAPPRKEAVSAAQPSAESGPPSPPVSPPDPAETLPGSPQFEFVYQVAAFQTDAQARALQQRLADVGGTISVEVTVLEGKPWYRVLVALRGTAADAEQLKIRLQTYGVAAPFLRAKKSL